MVFWICKITKTKSITSFHENIFKKFKIKKVLEVSTKSRDIIGIKLSAFNLKIKIKDQEYFLESLFQGSKVFLDMGPHEDIYEKKIY